MRLFASNETYKKTKKNEKKTNNPTQNCKISNHLKTHQKCLMGITNSI